MIVNGYGTPRDLAAHREQIEADYAAYCVKAEQRKAIAAMHAKNVAAEERMRAAIAAAQDPSSISWQGAAAALFLLALIIGAFLIATYLGT
jgi:hypothetical protein